MREYCIDKCWICDGEKKRMYDYDFIVKDKTGILGGLDASFTVNPYDYLEFQGSVRKVIGTAQFLHTADGRKIPIIELGDSIEDL